MTQIDLCPLAIPAETRAAIHALDRRLFPADTPLNDQFFRRNRFWVVRESEGGPVVAYASLGRRSNGIAYLSRLGVAQSHQKRGLGAALIHARLSWAQKQGLRTLVTDTAPDNVGIQRLLTRAGFEPYRPSSLWAGKGQLYWRLYL